MTVYILCVFSTLMLNVWAETLLKKGRNKSGMLFLLASLLILCIVAGARSIYVGTDVRVYVTRLAHVASENNFIDYILKPDSHFLFGVLVYIGYLFRNYNILLFVIELAVCVPIYIYSYKERHVTSLTLNILIFVLSMYCVSFNLIRQSIAISICILSYHYYKIKKVKTALILVGIAVLFHTTAFVFWGIYMIRFILNKKKENRFLAILLIGFLSIVILAFSEKIIGLTSYAYYLNNQALMRDFSLGSIAKRGFWIIMACFINGLVKGKADFVDSKMSIYMFFYAAVFNFMSFYIPGMGRLGYYFYDFALFLLVSIIPKVMKPKKITYMLIFGVLFFFWWNMTYVINDSAGVYPYRSDIFRFLN